MSFANAEPKNLEAQRKNPLNQIDIHGTDDVKLSHGYVIERVKMTYMKFVVVYSVGNNSKNLIKKERKTVV